MARKKKYYLKDDDVTIVEVEELAERMIEWSKEEGHLVLREFVASSGIPPTIFKRWLEKSEKLRNAYAIARALVGTRREIGALEGRLHPGIVMKCMPLYDEEYRELVQWEAKQRSPEPQSNQPILAVIEKFPNSDRVPELKKPAIGFKDPQWTIGEQNEHRDEDLPG